MRVTTIGGQTGHSRLSPPVGAHKEDICPTCRICLECSNHRGDGVLVLSRLAGMDRHQLIISKAVRLRCLRDPSLERRPIDAEAA
jgi:hypothetical protein